MILPSTDDQSEPLKAADLILDRYRVHEKLATGGHSVVYRGQDERLERPVCIKAFHGLAKDKGIYATVLEHFVQEAFALSRLTHPNTLRIYDFGHLQVDADSVGTPVQVSEYMGGGTLTSIVRSQGALAIEEALAIVYKLGDALGEAHRAGIIHRDIKPQNILFTEEREPKLADFGIAKSAAATGVHHQANETRITAGFPLAMYSRSWAAPEQLCGEDAAPASDIFSLALVAIFAMSGKVICNASSAREGYELRRDLTDRIAQSLNGLGLAPEIVALLQAACAFDKASRPSSAAEFVDTMRNAHAPALPALATSASPAQPPTSSPLHLHHKSTSWAHTGPSSNERPEPLSLGAEGTETTGVMSMPDEVPASTPSKGDFALRAAPIQRTPSILLSRRQPKQQVGTRDCEFIELGQIAVALQIGAIRLDLSSTPNPLSASGQSITLKGVSTFVAKAGGRPSRAVVLSMDEYVDLVNPRNQLLARIRVSFGTLEAGRYLFQLGNSPVAVDASECPNPILIDSPTHHQSFLLYGVSQSTVGRVTQR